MSETKHPADLIGKEILMASGILLSLTNCYDRQTGKFDVGQGFVFEALCNVERMLSQAGVALQDLYENHDLRSFEEIKSAALEAATARGSNSTLEIAPDTQVENLSEDDAEEELGDVSEDGLSADNGGAIGAPMPFIDYLKTSESAARLSDRLDAILERFPREEPPKKVAEPLDRVSKTYAEFLDKLTAMADAAAGEAKRAGKTELSLGPVLESLRADVKRLRAVA